MRSFACRYAFSAHTASGAQNCGANGVLIANGWTTKLEQYADIAAATALSELCIVDILGHGGGRQEGARKWAGRGGEGSVKLQKRAL